MTAVASSKHLQLFSVPTHHHTGVQSSSARTPYFCSDSLSSYGPHHPPPPHSSSPLLFSTTCSSREDSVSDSEISSISDSSELRALFTTLRNLNSSSPTVAGAGDGRYNQLKVKEGSKIGEKTRRILHRPSHFDSDSSSSLAESCESLTNITAGAGEGRKQKEKEHYDKLKLNLGNLSGNKKAISGLRVLYRDPPCGYRHLHSPTTSPSSSSSALHLNHHHHRSGHQGIFHQKSASEMAPRTKYWSEGHSNKIHSVNIDPIRSKSLSWRLDEPRVTSPQRECSVTPTHSTPVFRRRSLSETRSYDVVVSASPQRRGSRASSQKSSKSTENLSQQVSTFLRHIPARRSLSARGRIQQGETRERAYTDIVVGSRGRRGSFTADKRRSVKTSGSELETDRHSGSISFILSPVILKYEGEELEYHSQEHNFSIKIPKGATKKPGTVEIQVGLAIHGPFVFPESSRNASPILWLCSIPDTKFRKPIQISLPHCITEARPSSVKRRKLDDRLCLQFASASLKPASSKSRGRREFEFSPAEGEENIVCGPGRDEMSGTILTKHLSPLCIVACSGRMSDLSQEIALHAAYCVVPVIPNTVVGRQWNIHFCVTFDLPTCVQALRNYFSESEFQLMLPHSFKFAPPTIDEWEREGEPELEIRFPRRLPESGWRLALESERKISSSSVSFSPCRRSDHTLSLTSSINSSLTTTSSSSSPSAMFTISVDGTASQRDAVTCVSFVGSMEPVTVKISLPLSNSQEHPTYFSGSHHQQRGLYQSSPAVVGPGYDHLPLSPPASSHTNR